MYVRDKTTEIKQRENNSQQPVNKGAYTVYKREISKMNENTENKVRFVPAICSHCGGSLDVDPSQEAAVCPYCGTAFIVEKAINHYEAAVCPYCGTAFIVEKAINHYNMEHAEVNHVDHIEHVDNVTVDLKGSFDSVLGFASEQMKESRKMKAEMLNEQAARSLNRDKFMFKALFGMMGVMTVIGVIVHIVGF